MYLDIMIRGTATTSLVKNDESIDDSMGEVYLLEKKLGQMDFLDDKISLETFYNDLKVFANVIGVEECYTFDDPIHFISFYSSQ